MGKLDGKVAIITGAGTGIGRAGAIAFSREGARVLLAGPEVAPLEEAASACREAGGRAEWTLCDVSDWGQVEAMVRSAVASFGRVDVLYNNAGIAGTGTIDQLDVATWDRVLAVNLKGHFLCARAAVPEMRRAGGGVIINTSSVLAISTLRGQAAYSASKAAIIGLTRALAVDLADDHIRVVAIAPGSTDTAMMWGNATPEQRAAWAAVIREQHVARRVADPQEIARVVVFLASEEASFLSGSCIPIDGGTLARWGGGI